MCQARGVLRTAVVVIVGVGTIFAANAPASPRARQASSVTAHVTAARAAARSFPAHWPQSPARHARALRSAAATGTAPSFSSNLRGGFAIVGNTLLTCPENLRAGNVRASDATACLEANNNDKAMQYVNVDPGGGRFDSSTATLSVPAGSRVVQAYLYWGADLARGVTSRQRERRGARRREPEPECALADGAARARRRRVHDDRRHAGCTPGPLEGITSWYSSPGNRPGFAYQVRADVTNEVRAALSASTRRSSRGASLLDATVANVQAGKGNNRHGGWTLVVVWENETAAWRNLTLFDGFDFVQVQGGEQLVVGPLQFSGFRDADERSRRRARHELDVRGRSRHLGRLHVAREHGELVHLADLQRA